MLKIGGKIDEVRVDGRLDLLRRDLDRFSDLGLGAVEIPVHGLDAIVHGRLNRSRVTAVRDLLHGYDFTYSVHSPNPLNLMDRDHGALHYQVFRASLEFAVEIGAGVVVYHAGRYVPEETFAIPGHVILSQKEQDTLLDREACAIRDLADEFPDVCICIENARPYLYHSPYCYGENPKALRDLVLNISKPNVRVNLDTGHLYMAAKFYGFDPVDAVSDMAPLIAHAHVHDNFGLSIHHNEKQQTHLVPFGRGDAHMPVGWGEIPIGDLLGAFLEGYRGLLITELRSRYFDSTGESVASLQRIVAELCSRDGCRSFAARHR
ncbi:MAG TPA: sugar phosphate isomerase/epimerase [Syntrophales bacterium]|nr:sugar phosphate isomerase/epimerase [Syntrophobacterales bacterium]HQL91592.1 sugar phosphate isomerase/epimerase [Syntrophales bacterium]